MDSRPGEHQITLFFAAGVCLCEFTYLTGVRSDAGPGRLLSSGG